MHRPHSEVAQHVLEALEQYRNAVGPRVLAWYFDNDRDDFLELDDNSWARVLRELRENRWAHTLLRDGPGGVGEYQFEYYGGGPDPAVPNTMRGTVCALSCWLPTEFLEQHGPARVREVALAVAAPLPFNSGYASLSLNALSQMMGVTRVLRRQCFLHPGMEISGEGMLSAEIGTHVRGAYWMTFLGQPVLGALGGAAGLRARLHSPDITVQELDADRVAITLGTWPEAGDTEAGQDLPLYRELARVLEPWLFHQDSPLGPNFPAEDVRRWERRFLD
ncbi:type VI immunity family protein [Pyxidicoccus parkwayensis]|nr:type VI immunity family protein [Pyxidicoccus parkwaysis]